MMVKKVSEINDFSILEHCILQLQWYGQWACLLPGTGRVLISHSRSLNLQAGIPGSVDAPLTKQFAGMSD